jgi:hypothetical protein
MPWLALPFAQRAVATQLKELFTVGGIPTLVVIGPDGKVVTTEGRAIVEADPSGEKFPWMDMKKPLSPTEVKLIRYGCEHTALAAVKESEAGRLSDDKLQEVQEVLFLHSPFPIYSCRAGFVTTTSRLVHTGD